MVYLVDSWIGLLCLMEDPPFNSEVKNAYTNTPVPLLPEWHDA